MTEIVTIPNSVSNQDHLFITIYSEWECTWTSNKISMNKRKETWDCIHIAPKVKLKLGGNFGTELLQNQRTSQIVKIMVDADEILCKCT